MDKEHAEKKRMRIPEIDFFRGFALLLMIWHHAMYDVRYIFKVDAFAFQDSYWFYTIGRSVILALFLLVSGVSTRFSANNLKRGVRMLIFSVIATALTGIIHWLTRWTGVIFFNVIHVIALSTLCYALAEHLFIGRHEAHPDCPIDKERQKAKLVGFLIAFGVFTVILGNVIVPILPEETRSPLFVILGSAVSGVHTLDQLSLLPYLGYYLLGAAIGQTLYATGEPLWKSDKGWLHAVGRPFCFLGRNALSVYLLHQPITLAILWSLSKIGAF